MVPRWLDGGRNPSRDRNASCVCNTLGDKVVSSLFTIAFEMAERKRSSSKGKKGPFLRKPERKSVTGNCGRIPIVKWICASQRGFVQRALLLHLFRSHFSSNGIAIQGFFPCKQMNPRALKFFEHLRPNWNTLFLFRSHKELWELGVKKGTVIWRAALFFSHPQILRCRTARVIMSVIPGLHPNLLCVAFENYEVMT